MQTVLCGLTFFAIANFAAKNTLVRGSGAGGQMDVCVSSPYWVMKMVYIVVGQSYILSSNLWRFHQSTSLLM
jgi:hypothetical protein